MTTWKESKIFGKNRFCHLLALIAVLFSFQLQAQFYSIGVDPASVRWEQIESEHYRLIFPKEYQVEAKKIITNLEILYFQIGKSLNIQPRKTTLIVHNRTIESNGVTSFAPKRIELFTFQSNSSYAQPWMDQLIIHEMRHACQMDKLNSSTSRLLYYLFGEQIIGGIIGLYVPSWYFEGDAVLTETTLSKSGRGRTPIFTSELRSTLLSRGVDHYNKALFGSFKAPVADQYQQGFMMIKETEKQFGSDFWQKNLESTARNPFIPNPFRRSFKKQAGMSISRFYTHTMSQLKTMEEQRISKTKINDASPLVPVCDDYFNYESFAIINDTAVIAVKKQLNKIAQIVILKNRTERVLEENSLIVEGSLSCKKDIACWAERRYHPRWDQSSWIALVTYNFSTKKRTVIIPKSRLQYPSLSNNGSKIVAVMQSSTDQNSIQIINLNGALEKEIFPPQNNIVMQPQWCANDTSIVAILLNKSGKQLAVYSLKSNQWFPIAQPTHHDFLLWQIVGDSALITASDSDNTPVCKVSLHDGGTQIIATRPFDISTAQQSSTHILFCGETTASGTKIMNVSLNSGTPFNLFKPFVGDAYSSINRVDTLLEFPENADTNYQAKPYYKIAHLLNFHSWGPISINADNQTVNPGISINSQNSLSSSFLDAGISYSMAEENTTTFLNYSYKGRFTEISFGAQTAIKKYSETMSDNTITQHTWNQSEYSLQFQVPLLFQTPKYLIPLNISITGSDIRLTPTTETPANYKMGNLGALQLRLYHGVLKRKSLQALQPSFGYTVELNYKTDVLGEIKAGSIGAIESVIYIPGLLRNHGFQFYGGFQIIDRNQLYYSTLLQYPRGFIGVINSNAMSASVNYRFPLAYPDFSIGSLLYLKRLRVALFADYLNYENTNSKQEFSSTGIELIADSHWLRLVTPISFGGRFVYSISEKSIHPEIIFSINFDSL
jgi:hypothetical protein